MSFVGPKRALFGTPSWVPRGAVAGTDYRNNRHWRRTTDAITRASLRTAKDTGGTYSTFASNAIGRSNMGIRTEAARTNLVRNPSGEGASSTLPEILPDNWAYTPSTGLSYQCLGRFTVNGVSCTRLRIFGTASGAVANLINFETTTGIPATNAAPDTLKNRVFLRLVAAAVPLATGISSFKLTGREMTSAGAALINAVPSYSIELDGTLRRKAFDYTMTSGTAAFWQPCLRFATIDTGAVDFTIDIGWPQVEKNVATASSPIPNATYVAGPNLVTNPATTGAIAGTPGTMPTGWLCTPVATVAKQIIGAFTVDGIDCLRIRLFDANTSRTASNNLIFFDSPTAILADNVLPDVMLNTAYIRIQAGTTSGITAIRMSGRETNAAGTAVATLTSEAALTLTSTLTQRRDQYVMATAVAGGHFQPGLLVVAAATGAIDITLDIGLPSLDKNNSVTRTAPARAIDALTTTHPAFKGSAGGALMEFIPGDLLSTYTIKQIDDGTSSNRLSILYTSIDTMALRVTRSGVDDADVTIVSSRLVAGARSKIAVGWDSGHIYVSLNGRTAITVNAAMPFSGAATLRPGAVDGLISQSFVFPSALSAGGVVLNSSNNATLYHGLFSGQSNIVGAHGTVDYLLGTTALTLPAAFTEPPEGFTKPLMFQVAAETLTIGGTKIADKTFGTNRTSGAITVNADDMRVDSADLVGMTPLVARQFSTANTTFSGCEATARKLASYYGQGNYFLLSNNAVGGAGIRSLRKVPSALFANGVVPYADLMVAVQRAADIAAIQGWRYEVVLWSHNGHTSGFSPTPATEALEWEGLRTEAIADIQAISPSSNPVFIGELMSDFENAGRACVLCNVAIAEAGNWLMTGPTYAWFNLNGTKGYYGDNLHYNARGNAWSGERVANAFIASKAGTLSRCKATGATRVGAVITVAVTVPVLPLVRDAVNVVAPADDGIQVLKQSDSSALTVSSIAISGSNLVITLSADPGVPVYVDIALHGFTTAFTDHYLESEAAVTVYRDSSTGVFDYDGAPNYEWLAPVRLSVA